MAKVILPTALRAFVDGQKEVEVAGGTVGEVLESLASGYPDLKQHLYDGDGKLRAYVNVFIGEDNIRDFGGLAAPAKEDSVVTLVPAIAGGGGAV
ncbi:MAG: MoaD/ThiS family protein [Clostridiales Family XIII bacterium]|jgi:molybdopterin converting factor small subunit|nr:MoaD/ThiS family protein [Clostridiales Family XIII bacterium]